MTVSPYDTWDDAVATINDTPYGLQAGLFTNDVKRIMDAWERIEVGGLQVNSASTFRVDHMPYGGIKASGSKGIKSWDMTGLLMVLKDSPQHCDLVRSDSPEENSGKSITCKRN